MRAKRTMTEQARRTQIVTAAIEVIAASGSRRRASRRSREQAGLSSTGLISYHFANRQELIEEVGRRDPGVVRRLRARPDQEIEEPAEVLHGLRRGEHRVPRRATAPTRPPWSRIAPGRRPGRAGADPIRPGWPTYCARAGRRQLPEFDPQLVAVFILSIRDGIVRQLELEPDLDLDAVAGSSATRELATRKA